MSLSILIIEDERLAADKLQQMIMELAPDAEVLAVLASVSSATEWLTDHDHPDVIFSDIQLLDGICFDIFRQVEVKKPVIFTTAYDQYAIQAFELNSIDYLLKPIQPERLSTSLEKLKTLSSNRDESISLKKLADYLAVQSVTYKSRFMVKVGQKILSVPVESVAYFCSESKLTFLVTGENKRYPLDQTLEELQQQLNPERFFRANRKFIVSIGAIAEIHPYFKGRIKIKVQPDSPEEIVISSERTPDFKMWLDR